MADPRISNQDLRSALAGAGRVVSSNKAPTAAKAAGKETRIQTRTNPVQRASTTSVDEVTVLKRFIRLEKKAREVDSPRELAFLMVNESFAVVPYRQAALWWRPLTDEKGKGRIEALSGVSDPARTGPFCQWLEGLLARQSAVLSPNAASALMPAAQDRAQWQEYLPAWGLWVPLPLEKADMKAGLAFWREEPWTAKEAKLLWDLGSAYADVWRTLVPKKRSWDGKQNLAATAGTLSRKWAWRLGALAAAIAILCFPVRQSVLAPAEVAPINPFTVRAPLQGVVDHIAVKPNAVVKKGDLLVQMDSEDLRGRLQAARQQLTVAEAELRQAAQQAFADEQSKMALGVLEKRRVQALSDVSFLEGELSRTEIRAPRDGVAVVPDPGDWEGRPVAVGERILTLANPTEVQLTAEIPAGDAIELPEHAKVSFFRNAAPLAPIEGELTRISYRAEPTAEGTLAYRAYASIGPDSAGQPLRIGLKGSANFYGSRVPLALYLLRRPLATARVWVGL